MKKKVLSVLMALTMAVCIMAGCGSEATPTTTESTGKDAQTTEAAGQAE